jgi:hypothetical protein
MRVYSESFNPREVCYHIDSDPENGVKGIENWRMIFIIG